MLLVVLWAVLLPARGAGGSGTPGGKVREATTGDEFELRSGGGGTPGGSPETVDNAGEAARLPGAGLVTELACGELAVLRGGGGGTPGGSWISTSF